jgi:NodT family efflux transporter outer membrane factor (OMF) lipoprotein
VGPNFKEPAAPNVTDYTERPLEATGSTKGVAGGDAQSFVRSRDIPGDWWTLFHSKALNDLIERSLKASPDVKAAQAALVVARENVSAQAGSYYPSVGGGFSAVRQKTSEYIAPVPNSNAFIFNLYTSQVTVSYVPDVFGLNRRNVESLEAQAEQQRFALIATYITLSSNVAAAAIQEASLRGQIDATQQLIDINTKMLDLLRQQFVSGYSSRLDVAAQESQLAQVAATLPPLQKQLVQQRDLLAALSGGYASEGLAETFELSDMQLPREIPVSLPSQLVEQRPDVRQAEENMHAACAQIGVAVANRLPNLTLTGNAGSMALAIGQLTAPGAGFWTIGAELTQPIFEGGTLLHRERAARAAYQEAAEEYRGTVITAFQNVADTLNALEQDARALQAVAAAEQAAKVTLDLTNRQLQSGYTNYLAVLNAEQTYQQAAINLIQAEANRYADTAALFQALGGGWWNRAELTKE